MKSLTFLFLAAALTLSTTFSTSAALVPLPQGVKGKVFQDVYFATFPAPAGTPEAKSEQENFRQELKNLGIEISERYSFSHLVNAISFQAEPKHLEKIQTLKSVHAVFPMLKHQPPRVIASKGNPKLRFAHGITGVTQAQQELGLSGKGIKVGVIDSGIDYTHPALGGCFGKGCKVAYGYDFVGDNYTGENEPNPDDDPIDSCEGHGTHVAGIIGAKDKDFVGVAPEVTLGAYRILGCKGSVSTDLIITAMERALEDGMDVVSMSIGGGSSWSAYPDAVAADALVKKGIVVVAAGGNDGEKGLWQSESPGLGENVIGVASFDNIKYMTFGFSANGLSQDIPYSGRGDNDPVVLPPNMELDRFLDDQGGDLGCNPLPPIYANKIVLIQRGNCTFQVKATNAIQAKAAGVLIYNNVFGGLEVSVENITIPVVSITQANGKLLLDRLVQNTTDGLKITFKKDLQAFDTPTGGKISDFSSWGPSPLMRIKPDIGAPGGLIYSTFPVALGSYATLSGTSMATPYISGSVALYLQSKGKVNPLQVRDAFKNTAHATKTWDGEFFSSAFRQGAGMIDLKAALTVKTTVTPAVLALNSTDAGSNRHLHQLTIRNLSPSLKHYHLTHQPAVAVQPWDKKTEGLLPIPILAKAEGKVKFPGGSIAIRPGESKTVQFTIDPPSTDIQGRERFLYSGYILINSENETISVPYGGMRGDYRSIRILSKTNHPELLTGVEKSVAPENTTFSMKGNDTPAVAFRLLFPCRKVVVSLLDAKHKEMGIINNGESDYLGQNDDSAENLIYTQNWDGIYIKGNQTVPAADGEYALKLSVLKPYGNVAKINDYETWTSMNFKIDRTLPEKGVTDTGKSVTLTDVKKQLIQANSEQVKYAQHLAITSPEPRKLILKKETE